MVQHGSATQWRRRRLGRGIQWWFWHAIDGSEDAEQRLQSMLHWDVTNGVARRAWARNQGAIKSIKQAMEINDQLKITIPESVQDSMLDDLFKVINLTKRNVTLDGETLNTFDVADVAYGHATVSIPDNAMMRTHGS